MSHHGSLLRARRTRLQHVTPYGPGLLLLSVLLSASGRQRRGGLLARLDCYGRLPVLPVSCWGCMGDVEAAFGC